MNTQMHMSPNSHNGTTPSSSSSGHREGTSTFPPPPPPSTPVTRSCPPGPTSTVFSFSSDDDEEQDRGMASPASHRTTHIEILKDAPGSKRRHYLTTPKPVVEVLYLWKEKIVVAQAPTVTLHPFTKSGPRLLCNQLCNLPPLFPASICTKQVEPWL